MANIKSAKKEYFRQEKKLNLTGLLNQELEQKLKKSLVL